MFSFIIVSNSVISSIPYGTVPSSLAWFKVSILGHSKPNRTLSGLSYGGFLN
jgi:hypothetical protein